MRTIVYKKKKFDTSGLNVLTMWWSV